MKLGIVLLLLIITSVIMVYKIQKVNAFEAIYIKSDGSIDPPTAPIQTFDNITYTLTANIYDCFVAVGRDNVVIDGGTYFIQGPGYFPGIELIDRKNVTIKNIEIRAFEYGIWIQNSNYSMICESKIIDNRVAIWAWDDAHHNVISGNRIMDDSGGVRLYTSSNNTVINNNFTGNGLVIDGSHQNTVYGNLVNDKPLVYLENVSDYSVENAGQVILLECDRIKVEDLNLSDTTVGVEVYMTNNTVVSKNSIRNNYYGILVAASFNITINENEIKNNSEGIGCYGFTNSNAFGNIVTGNEKGIRIHIFNYGGVLDNNYIVDNDYGVYCDSAWGGTLSRNTIVGSKVCGIWLSHWWDGVFFHNNVINNTLNCHIEPYMPSFCDWDYDYEGNYWDDYNGTDFFSGPYQNETGSDGIGDMPYILDSYNQDDYPLMDPYNLTTCLIFNVAKGEETYSVQLFSNGTVFSSHQTLGSIQVSLIGYYMNEACVEITCPIGLNSTNIKVFVNNARLTFPSDNPLRFISFNGSHYLIYFAFNFTHNGIHEMIFAFSVEGDVDYDGIVNMRDIGSCCSAFVSYPEHINWNPHCDINEDNTVNMRDIGIACNNFMNKWE